MLATIRRYDGVDQNRSAELNSKVNETLVPKLNRLRGSRAMGSPAAAEYLGWRVREARFEPPTSGVSQANSSDDTDRIVVGSRR